MTPTGKHPSGIDADLKAALADHRAGRMDAARRGYAGVLQRRPDHPQALHGLAVLALNARDDRAAADLLTRLVRARPKDARAHNLLGLAHKRLGDVAAAEAAFRKAVALDPRHAEALANLGAVLHDRGDLAGAATALERAVALAPGLAFARNSLGMIRRDQGRHADAAAAYRAALAAGPDNPVVLNNLGNALSASGDLDGALAAFRRALERRPDYAEVHCNLGKLLTDRRHPAEAEGAYRKAVALNPRLAEAHLGLGWTLLEAGRDADAAEAFRAVLALEPDSGAALTFLVRAEARRCRWDDLADLEAAVRARVAEGADDLAPLVLSELDTTPAECLAAARARCKAAYGGYAPLPAVPAGPREVLTIGYLSPDLGEHPVGRLLPAILESHDRGKVRTIGYALNPDDGSALRRRLVAAFDTFADLSAASDADVAAHIRADGVDVLVDLAGHTHGARMGIPARRPAPVQCAWLGYPGTTGADFIDYLVADAFVAPTAAARDYCEALVHLPGCYLVADPGREVGPAPARGDAGLPERGFVFCAFHRTDKLRPATFDVWMRILDRVPESVLWLTARGEAADRLRAEAERRGVDPDRLVFAARVPEVRDHLGRLRLAGLFLDTRPYNAHATAIDALHAGVPVLTCPGDGFAGRVGGSLLTSLGLVDLIAPDMAAYERMAVHLATHPEELAALRDRLARAKGPGTPFDPVGHARALEAAFRAMWERHAAGASPAPITVPAGPARPENAFQ